MGRGIDNGTVIGRDKGTGGDTLAGRNLARLAAIGAHPKNRITRKLTARRLEDQILPVMGKIGLGILTTKGQLPDIHQAGFIRNNKRFRYGVASTDQW